MSASWQLLDHTADLGMDVEASSLEELFACAGKAIFELMAELDAVEIRVSRDLVVEGTDLADLWVNFLREALYLWSGEGQLMKEVKIRQISDTALEATLSGEAYDSHRHVLNMEIKAATYHQAEVVRTPKGWKGRVIFDV
ncbi:SHS2 domain-containing protein [Syntrophus gentianae]|uniref:SHS2 domain-containing protein n=1 Tax=Syntrophus gentianae TaxID=43775 RepID=A0A1H7VJM2_9BACT|nr:archease [Syntrophus gentianae]SEM09045.1 SHS2 domain-containing protein [Syntrophus gentianae]